MTADKPTPVPRLRFPEFQDAPDWKTGRCRDIAKVLPGYGFPDKFQGNKKGQYPFYKVSDISHTIEKGQRYISKANNYIDSDVLDTIRGNSVPAGTIIFAKIGEAIRSNRRAITTKPAIMDNNTAGVKAIKAKSSDEFLFYLWSNVSLIDYAGGVVPAVSKSTLENVPLCYPSDPAEQKRIADCLGSLDDLIAAEGRKLEALRQHKQGLMQQLFPQPGETLPQLRFPEFQNAPEWSLESIVEFAQTTTGKRDTQDKVDGGSYPFFVRSQSTERIDTYAYNGEAVLTSGDGVGVGKNFHFTDGKFDFHQRVYCIHQFKSHVLGRYFFFYFSEHFGPRVRRMSAKNSVDSVRRSMITDMPVPLPDLAEQKTIADCLSALDTLIDAQVTKLNTLRTHKQGLLQQLFPSLDGQ